MRLLAMAFCCVAILCGADFGGTWRLVLSQSDFGKVPPPQSQEVTVRQDGDRLQVQSTLVDQRGTARSEYALDATGKPVENQIRGSRVESVASWRGPVLHVKSKTTIQNTEIKSVDQWQLEENGRRLVIYRTATTPQGDVEQRYVYEKVSGGR